VVDGVNSFIYVDVREYHQLITLYLTGRGAIVRGGKIHDVTESYKDDTHFHLKDEAEDGEGLRQAVADGEVAEDVGYKIIVA